MTDAPLSFPRGFTFHETYAMRSKELLLAAIGGATREIQDMLKHRKHRWACENDRGWGNHIDGCIGEFVLARKLDRFWSPGEVGASDLEGCGLEVRASRHENPSLILHPSDHDDRIYVLAWLHWEHVVIPGWLYGREGKRQGHWREKGVRHPAFFVPRSELHPIETLKAKLGQRSADEVAW
jgi:hypothetical protein